VSGIGTSVGGAEDSGDGEGSSDGGGSPDGEGSGDGERFGDVAEPGVAFPPHPANANKHSAPHKAIDTYFFIYSSSSNKIVFSFHKELGTFVPSSLTISEW